VNTGLLQKFTKVRNYYSITIMTIPKHFDVQETGSLSRMHIPYFRFSVLAVTSEMNLYSFLQLL